jgi:hypothetical protein
MEESLQTNQLCNIPPIGQTLSTASTAKIASARMTDCGVWQAKPDISLAQTHLRLISDCYAISQLHKTLRWCDMRKSDDLMLDRELDLPIKGWSSARPRTSTGLGFSAGEQL